MLILNAEQKGRLFGALNLLQNAGAISAQEHASIGKRISDAEAQQRAFFGTCAKLGPESIRVARDRGFVVWES